MALWGRKFSAISFCVIQILTNTSFGSTSPCWIVFGDFSREITSPVSIEVRQEVITQLLLLDADVRSGRFSIDPLGDGVWNRKEYQDARALWVQRLQKYIEQKEALVLGLFKEFEKSVGRAELAYHIWPLSEAVFKLQQVFLYYKTWTPNSKPPPWLPKESRTKTKTQQQGRKNAPPLLRHSAFPSTVPEKLTSAQQQALGKFEGELIKALLDRGEPVSAVIARHRTALKAAFPNKNADQIMQSIVDSLKPPGG